MNRITAVFQKDLKDLITKKIMLGIFLVVIVFPFSLTRILPPEVIEILKTVGSNSAMADVFVSILLVILMLLVVSFAAGVLFFEEKLAGSNIESLLTTPICLSELITGKALACLVVAYGITILILAGLIVSLQIQFAITILPSLGGFLQYLLLLPLFVFSYVFLFGTVLFSVRSVQSVNLIRIIFLFGIMTVVSQMLPVLMVSVPPLLIFHAISISLALFSVIALVLSLLLVKRLNSEKILLNMKR